MKNNLISIGKILNFHGIKGEIKMGYTAGNESLIKNLRCVYIFINNEKCSFHIESVRFHKNFSLVKLKEINSIDDVMRIKGLLVLTEEADVQNTLDSDEFLIKDLIGVDVYDEKGNKIGIVDMIGENRASDLLAVKKISGQTFMVPFVKALVPIVDLKNNKIVVNMIDGLDGQEE